MQTHHKINLLVTARALLMDPKHIINMQLHASGAGGTLTPAKMASIYERQGNTCGTSSCFAGYGPVAGIEPLDAFEGWSRYTKRVYGVSGAEWCFLFSSNHPDSAELCAIRALTLVTKRDRIRALLLDHDLDEKELVDEINYDELCKHLGEDEESGVFVAVTGNLVNAIDLALRRLRSDLTPQMDI